MMVRAKLLFLMLAVSLCTLHIAQPSVAVAQPADPQDSSKPGQYQMVYHWNHLDWNFADPRMKRQFEANQYWKQAMPAGIKVDRHGSYYVSVPRWAKGIPSTMNRIVLKDGKPLLEAFPSWEWNKEGSPGFLQSVLGYEIDEQNRMWLLDQGHIAYAPSQDGSQKLVIWDLNTNKRIDSIKIPNEIAAAVQTIGSKGTNTDGMHADNKGNVYYTMLEDQGVGCYSPETRKFNPFVSDDRMLWVDGVAFDQKGSIIFNNNRLHQMFERNQDDINWDYPYNLIIWKAFVGKDVKSYLYAS